MCWGVQIALKSDFLSTSHCLLYGELPGAAQAEEFRSTVMRFSKLPSTVIDAMEALPTNAHPMSVVMSAVVALGALHPEQNPALAGNAIYKDKGVQDTQVVRLLGAMPSIAAYAYYRCVQHFVYPLSSCLGWWWHGLVTVYTPGCMLMGCCHKLWCLQAARPAPNGPERAPTLCRELSLYAGCTGQPSVQAASRAGTLVGHPSDSACRARDELLHCCSPASRILGC